MQTHKITKKILINEEIDLARFALGPDTDIVKYKLSAICFHHGDNAQSGHYTSNNISKLNQNKYIST